MSSLQCSPKFPFNQPHYFSGQMVFIILKKD